jgi:hypothetical protein
MFFLVFEKMGILGNANENSDFNESASQNISLCAKVKMMETSVSVKILLY